jgi:HK97 family phage major capsid protein/HK97 family phage prohead protease
MTMTNRAYSLLEIKSYDDDKRIITGIASTSETDRQDDQVISAGAEFSLPVPFLWQHDALQPLGHVTEAKVTSKGINVTVQIAKVDEPGRLKDRLDECWQSIRHGLVKGLSIGFKPLETERIEGSFGVRFKRWLWLELSAVTVAANGSCEISTIKSIDTAMRAATGQTQSDDVPVHVQAQKGERVTITSPAPGKSITKVVKAQEAKSQMSKKSYAEQISAFEATLQAKNAEIDTIMDAAADKGETLDAEAKEKCDTLEMEVKEIGEHIVRLRASEERSKSLAKPVVGDTQKAAASSREGVTHVVQARRNVEKGVIFTRLLGAKYLAYKSNGMVSPLDIARNKFGDTPEVESILRAEFQKAAIAAGTTTDSTWASPLVELTNAASEFVELLRPATIIGRIPGLTRVPFNQKIPRGTSDPTAYWVGEGAVKPLSAMAFDSIELLFNKVAGIVPMTEELMRFSNPAAEGLVRNGLIAAIAYLTDRDFLDPSKAEVVGVSPASVTNGVTPIAATGVTADALRDDMGSLIAEYLEVNMNVGGLVLVMTSAQAMRLSLMRNSLGQKEFTDITLNGGVLEGIPVITSENIVAMGGSPTDGYPIVAINAPEVLLADDGGVEIDISREASLQMDSAPDSPETTSTILVSLWQRNMVAIRAERFITWKKRRTGAVQYISYAKYA